MRIKNNFSRGFTLIELLVVIAIIGILATIVIYSLSGAKDKASITANKKEAKQLANLLELEYAENGNYSNLLKSAWIPNTYSCDNINVTGNYSTQYRKICNSIANRLGSTSTAYNWLVGDGTESGGQKFSVMVKVSPSASTAGQWFCIGSSGRVYNGTYNSYGPGCYYNP